MVNIFNFWIDVKNQAFFLSLLDLGDKGALFKLAVREYDFEFDFLFLAKPVKWFIEKVKKLFGGK